MYIFLVFLVAYFTLFTTFFDKFSHRKVKQIKNRKKVWSDKVSHIHRHLVYLCVVKLLYILQHPLILASNEVDGHTLAAKTPTTTNPEKRERK